MNLAPVNYRGSGVGNRRLARMSAGTLVATIALLAAPSLAAAEPKPFGHACKLEHGVRFCPTASLSERVPTFDGVPLDVDVTLPQTGAGPFPAIVMIHGWGGSKTDFEATSPEGNGNETFDYNNIYYAQHGYAVLNYTARGWGRSCGSKESREADEAGCKEGWIRLADQRFEARDTQYLFGVLADEGIVKPTMIGTTGISYGGGQSIELAYLKNRIRKPNGEFAPWTSPKGKKMTIAAAYPRWPWSDLVDALTPNGRFLDTEIAPKDQSFEPFGVEIQSYVAGLFALGAAGGYYAPEGMDPEADLPKWFAVTNAGEPVNPEDEAIAKQLYTYHQGYGMPLEGKPAPLLVQNGWTDALFPVEQALRVYNQVRALKGYVALQVGDLGHSDGSNKVNTDHAFQEAGATLFAKYLKGEGAAPKSGGVTAYTQTCPKEAPDGGPFVASTWAELHKHAVSFSSSGAQTLTSAGGNATIAAEFDPIANSNACKSIKAETEPDTANYTMVSKGFTLMGLPTITATIKTTGSYGEVAARLWDISPGGEQTLISRGIYRLTENQTGTIAFQLHGNGFEFANGHTVELQLLGRDAPYYRASNFPFTVEVSALKISLPTP